MPGRPAAAATLLLASILLCGGALAQQQTCRISSVYGDYEYPCGDETAAQEDAPWWANDTAQAVVGLVGLTASAGAGAYAFYRVRMRRRTLSDLVRSVESAYAESKADPAAGLPKLVGLRSEVRARHVKGRIEDAQFLELDRRIGGYLARLRRIDLDTRFAGLPPGLLRDLHERVGDGLVSGADVAFFERHPGLLSVAPGTRRDLLDLLRAWAVEDTEPAEPAAPPAAAA